MTLLNFVTLVVLKILTISFPCKVIKMQITSDVSKISKTVQSDLTFILNVLSESSILFALFSIVLAKKNTSSFTENFTLRNYAGTCKGIFSYNLVYNFFI